MLTIHSLTACHRIAPASADWFKKGRAMCNHVCVILHVKDPQLPVKRVGHCASLAGFCLSLYGLHVLNRDVISIQTKCTLSNHKHISVFERVVPVTCMQHIRFLQYLQKWFIYFALYRTSMTRAIDIASSSNFFYESPTFWRGCKVKVHPAQRRKCITHLSGRVFIVHESNTLATLPVCCIVIMPNC